MIKNVKRKLNAFIKKNPLKTLITLLAILFVFIAIGEKIRTPQTENNTQIETKKINAFYIGTTPTVEVSATIKKSGVQDIYAQTSGIVSNIYAQNGSYKTQGQWIVGLSSTYGGGNTMALQRQIAQAQYNNLADTYETQKELINKQIKLAEKNDAKLDELREISQKSKDETQDLLNLNEEILSTLEQNIADLENSNIGGANDATILSTKQLRSQYLSAVNASKSAIRNLELDEEDDLNQTLNQTQKEIALKQLDLQNKSLELSKEVSELQLKLAKVNESLMFPAMPFGGTVEQIHVQVGQNINPGTKIATISGDINSTTLEAYVTKDIAKSINKTEASKVSINGTALELTPEYITSEATNNNLYGVVYRIPEEYSVNLRDGESVTVSIPAGIMDSTTAATFVPIDAVFITQNDSYIYVYENGKAISKSVELGYVTGNYVEVLSGLNSEEIVITNRNIVDGDNVEIL